MLTGPALETATAIRGMADLQGTTFEKQGAGTRDWTERALTFSHSERAYRVRWVSLTFFGAVRMFACLLSSLDYKSLPTFHRFWHWE